MRIFLLFTLLFSSLVFAETNSSVVSVKTKQELAQEKKKALKAEKELQERVLLSDYKLQLKRIEKEISKEKVWVKSYASYLTSLGVRENLIKIKKRIKQLKKKRNKSKYKEELNALISKEMILRSQIEQLKENNSAPFSKLITPPIIDKIPSVTNPFDIFSGLSLIKTLNLNFEEYKKRENSLEDLIELLEQENEIYKEILILDRKNNAKDAFAKQQELERFKAALDTISVTSDVYQKRLEIIEINLNKAISQQLYGLMKIGVVIFIVLLVFLLLKLVVKKYIKDNERYYMANKIITFTNFTIIILILFFNYIENAGHLVTILGFASAGIAIAMKDWFMSILGWLVIVIGGSIHVGDRIRVDMDGMKYVGDVMDISLLRMTILEDITLTSIMQNRRAGRIVFIPNNYVFTRMIANYTHSSLKTVWDGVRVTITFDSNHKKAIYLAKEITKKFSKGYTDITRKQLNKLRHSYSLKNTGVEPRIFSFIEPNGLSIECWYLTNAYGTLTLRSVISTELIDAFNGADDITIAYPTQKLHISTNEYDEIEHNHEIV